MITTPFRVHFEESLNIKRHGIEKSELHQKNTRSLKNVLVSNIQ